MTVSNTSARFLFDIMELLGRSEAPLGLTEVRRLLNLPVATAHRGLVTLEQSGFAERYQASTRYVLGPLAKRLRQAVIARFALCDRALPHLRRLSVTTGETTSLSVRVGWYAVRLAAVRGPSEVSKRSVVGEACRLDEELAGRIILSLLPVEEATRFRSYCDRAGRPASETRCPDPSGLRARGYALEAIVNDPGLVTIAAPLHDRDGEPTAVVCIERLSTAVADGPAGVDATDWETALRDVTRSLGPIENHYSHLDPDTIGLSGKHDRLNLSPLAVTHRTVEASRRL